jgi:hypothetical protein
LSLNAEEYAKWLVRREKYVINAQPLVEKAKRKKEAIQKARHQNAMCLKCKSSVAMNGGFFCAIHPMGLPVGVPDIQYCPDFLD